MIIKYNRVSKFGLCGYRYLLFWLFLFKVKINYNLFKWLMTLKRLPIPILN